MRATAFCLCLFMLMSCQNNSGDVADNGEPTKDGGDPGDVIDVEEEILPPMPCIEDWPKFPEVAPVPSLTKTDGEWGDIIWRKELGWQSLRYPIAFDGEHLALTGGNKLWILDTSGNITGEFPEFTSMIGSAPVADGKGNFLFATQGLFSVTAKGEQRWVVPFGKNISSSYETTETSSILLSPDGIAYVSATDGFLYAINSENGEIIWKKEVGLYLGYRPKPLHFGVGNMIFIENKAFNRETGQAYSLPEKDGQRLVAASGIANSELLAMGHVISALEFYEYFYDRCGNYVWGFPATGRTASPVVGFNDVLWTMHGPDPVVMRIYAPTGEPLSGSKEMISGYHLILGADNIAYSIRCSNDNLGDGQAIITAYSESLEERWSKEYEISCIEISEVLGKDGIIYLAHEKNSRIEIVAIRTESPGLAKTSRPIYNFNNRRTGWLAPEQ